MSKETSQWLNQNVLVGMTAERGNAWHYRKSSQGAEPNHYTGPIPYADVERRLIDWEAVSRRVAVEKPATYENMTHLGESGEPLRWAVQRDRQAIDTSDTHETLGLFKAGYKPHQFKEWLLENIQGLLSDDLIISSAGLLRNRAVMWTEVSVPETKSINDVLYRPNLLSATSFDGTLATTYKRTIGATVCDNTLSAALTEEGTTLKFKHTANSGYKVAQTRDALKIIESTSKNFEAAVRQLTSAKIGNLQFKEVLSVLVPVDEESSPLAQNAAHNKRNALTSMLHTDPRVAPWKDNAFGVLQLFNTWDQHERPVRGETQRVERNMFDTLSGKVEKTDAGVLEALHGLQLI
jgi:phage/plasmid-like protein (TIGR03299 family)